MEQIKSRVAAKIELYSFLNQSYIPILMKHGQDPETFLKDSCTVVFTYLAGKFTVEEMFAVVEELAGLCQMVLPVDCYGIFIRLFSAEMIKFNHITTL